MLFRWANGAYCEVTDLVDMLKQHGPPLGVVAVLSTTLTSGADGLYASVGLNAAPEVAGVPNYVGHPATRYLLDGAGAVYTPGLFQHLEVGQSFVVCQLKDPRKGAAFTSDAPNVGPEDLKWGVVTRVA